MDRNLFESLIIGFIVCWLYVGNINAVISSDDWRMEIENKTMMTEMIQKLENNINTNDKLSFANKVIIITGASSGIGAHAAVHLAKKGASVSLIGRNENHLNEVSAQIRNAGAPIPLVIVADVTKDARRIIDDTVNHFGKLDILINSAAVAKPNNAINIEMNDYDWIMNVNLRSIIELTKLAIPHLKKSKGNILNISSINAIRNSPNLFVYSMSKAALNKLTKYTARDLGPIGIRVNALSPGVIRTPIFQKTLGWTTEQVEQFYNEEGKIYATGHVGDVTDTSAAIEFLIGDSATFITGAILTVDGGALV